MGAHAGSAGVQEQGCGALWNLATQEQAKVRQAGGAAAVERAQGAFAANPAVRKMADGAMKAMR